MPVITGLGAFSNAQFQKAVADFKCEKHPELLDYLKHNAHTHHKQGLFQTYLYGDGTEYRAYISLASAQITEDDGELKSGLGISDKMPYTVPALKITRLCISDVYQGRKIGTLLIEFAKMAAYEQQSKVGCRALLVDAKPEAIGFYKKMGFVILSEMAEGLTSMFMDIPSLRAKELRDEPAKRELVGAFIAFCNAFDLPQFAAAFKKMLDT